MQSSKKSIIFVPSMHYYRVPSFIQRFFHRYIWRMAKNEQCIYLTFDDGPNDIVTNEVLDILRKNKIKATFFSVGENAKKFPEVMDRIVSEGHSIGNHTYNHLKGWTSPIEEYIENVEKCQMQLLNHDNCNLFRPPYGRITKKQGKALIDLGYKIIMWDILSYDYDKNLNCKDGLKKISNRTRNGSIIVFHDSLKAQPQLLQILPEYIENMLSRGFEFKPLI